MTKFTIEVCRTHFLSDAELDWTSLMFELPFAPEHVLQELPLLAVEFRIVKLGIMWCVHDLHGRGKSQDFVLLTS